MHDDDGDGNGDGDGDGDIVIKHLQLDPFGFSKTIFASSRPLCL